MPGCNSTDTSLSQDPSKFDWELVVFSANHPICRADIIRARNSHHALRVCISNARSIASMTRCVHDQIWVSHPDTGA